MTPCTLQRSRQSRVEPRPPSVSGKPHHAGKPSIRDGDEPAPGRRVPHQHPANGLPGGRRGCVCRRPGCLPAAFARVTCRHRHGLHSGPASGPHTRKPDGGAVVKPYVDGGLPSGRRHAHRAKPCLCDSTGQVSGGQQGHAASVGTSSAPRCPPALRLFAPIDGWVLWPTRGVHHAFGHWCRREFGPKGDQTVSRFRDCTGARRSRLRRNATQRCAHRVSGQRAADR